MYLPPHFQEPRPEELHRLIRAHPLGALVVNGPTGLDANHLPFELDPHPAPHGSLLAHVARANPLWQEAHDGDEALVIFRPHDAYVSPNWYPSKHESHRQVPTWNYQVVHAHGRLRIRDDPKFLRALVGRLTRTHESRTGDPHPWTMAQSDPAFIDSMLASIVGIQIEITRLTGKSKLGQNKSDHDRETAAAELHRHGHHATATAMTNARKP